jgi:hypothetical protein
MGGRLGGDRGGRLGLHLGAVAECVLRRQRIGDASGGRGRYRGVAAAIVSYLIARVLPRWLTSSFVDVVRYLDTSPRSYAVRRDIRKGLVEMLQALHASKAPRYDRIVLVAHSLGAYLAYDAIAYLWGLTNARTAHDGKDVPILSGLSRPLPRCRHLRTGSHPRSTTTSTNIRRHSASCGKGSEHRETRG